MGGSVGSERSLSLSENDGSGFSCLLNATSPFPLKGWGERLVRVGDLTPSESGDMSIMETFRSVESVETGTLDGIQTTDIIIRYDNG